jgi:hypothetical protein
MRRRRSSALRYPARLGWYGAGTGPCKEASTALPSVASRGTVRRRWHGKLPRTRAAPAGSTRAPSCSEETIPNPPERKRIRIGKSIIRPIAQAFANSSSSQAECQASRAVVATFHARTCVAKRVGRAGRIVSDSKIETGWGRREKWSLFLIVGLVCLSPLASWSAIGHLKLKHVHLGGPLRHLSTLLGGPLLATIKDPTTRPVPPQPRAVFAPRKAILRGARTFLSLRDLDEKSQAWLPMTAGVSRVCLSTRRFGVRSNYAKSNHLGGVPVPNVYLFGTFFNERRTTPSPGTRPGPCPPQETAFYTAFQPKHFQA